MATSARHGRPVALGIGTAPLWDGDPACESHNACRSFLAWSDSGVKRILCPPGQKPAMPRQSICQDLVSSVVEGALQEYKQGNNADRRTPELCCPSVECQRLSSKAWLPIAISFAETRGLPTSAVISLGSFLVPTKPYKGSMTCKSGTPRALAAGRCMPRCSKPSGTPRR